MGFFSKKPTTVEELTKAIAALSEEDKKKLYEKAFERVDEPSKTEAEETTMDETAESVSEAEVATEETTEGNDGGEQTDTEPETPAEEYVEQENSESDTTAETEEVTQNTEERHEDVVGAFAARLEAVEQRLTEFVEIMSDFVDLRNDDSPLGAAAQAEVGNGEDELSEDDRIMSNYNPNWRRG